MVRTVDTAMFTDAELRNLDPKAADCNAVTVFLELWTGALRIHTEQVEQRETISSLIDAGIFTTTRGIAIVERR